MSMLIIVDLDGTLVDTKDINFKAYSEALGKFGFEIGYEYFCKFCNGGHYTEFIPDIVEDNSLHQSIHEEKKQAYSKYLQYAVVNEELVAEIHRLKAIGWKSALVTTASRLNTGQLIEATGLTDLFDLILTREDVEKPKPNPEGFLKAMHIIGATPENTIIYEDSEPGIRAAQATKAIVKIVTKFNICDD